MSDLCRTPGYQDAMLNPAASFQRASVQISSLGLLKGFACVLGEVHHGLSPVREASGLVICGHQKVALHWPQRHGCKDGGLLHRHRTLDCGWYCLQTGPCSARGGGRFDVLGTSVRVARNLPASPFGRGISLL